jgi:type VI secretion system protein ImpH
MASPARHAPDPVIERAALENALRDTPEAFHFFAAVRRLECAHPDRPRLGHSTRAVDDFVRLCHTPSLRFAPRAIDRYVPGGSGRPAKLYGLFFGLFGPNGPLPLHLTEYAVDRARNERDTTFSAFADIFHHRMLSLLHRAWADSEPTVQFDRPKEDRFRHYVGALVGLSSGALEGRAAIPDEHLRHYVGRMLSVSRNSEGLNALIGQFFRVPVAIVDFVTEWMRLPAQSHLALGSSPDLASLGRTTVIGEYVWGGQQRFRIRLGPLTRREFNKFLPGGEALKQLVSAVRSYIGDEKGWDLQLILKKEYVPAVKLGKSGQLGLSSWMAPLQPALDDREDVILKPVG